MIQRGQGGERIVRGDGSVLRLEVVLGALRRLEWGKLGVKWAILFGSLASRGRGRDVDLLVMPRGIGGPEWRLRLGIELAETIGVDWGAVDVVEASTTTPCPIVLDAWRNGLLVYEEEKGEAREWLLVRIKVCNDYLLAARKLQVLETGIEAAKKRWGH